jgi:Ca-activated chloride channel family protein
MLERSTTLRVLPALTLAVIVSAAPMIAAESPPLALRAEAQMLGAGEQGTVVGVVLSVAPEDRDRVGERCRIGVSLIEGKRVLDRQSSVIAFEQDGTALLYYEWPPGSYQLRVELASLTTEASGLWIGDIEVGTGSQPFRAPEGAPADAIALEVTPSREGAVQFLPPPDLGGIGGLQLEVEVPEATASVEFFHDDTAVGRRNRPPWTVSVALGEIVRRTVVRAIARDSRGRILGEDAIVLNNPTGQLGVEILLGEPDETTGSRRVTVSVSGAQRLQQVTLSLDDRKVARWIACPCIAEIDEKELRSAAILATDAVDAKGARGDAVLPVDGGGGFVGMVRVELVELPLVVLDEGSAPITGLGKEAFRVLEDDTEVAIEGFGTTAELPLSLAIAVDISGSMHEVFPRVREIVSGFAERLLRPGDEVILLTFSWDTERLLDWTDEIDSLAGKLDRVEPEGGTSLHDGVIHSLEQFRGRRGRQALVVLTDGEDTTSRSGWRTAERYAHTMRIPVFAIGLGVGKLDVSSRRVLKDLAFETGGDAFFPADVDELAAVYARIDELLRSQYLIWYASPSEKPSEQFREVRVELTEGSGTVRTIRGYYPGK